MEQELGVPVGGRLRLDRAGAAGRRHDRAGAPGDARGRRRASSSRCSGPDAAPDIYRDLGLLELFAEKTADRADVPAARRPPGRHRAPLRVAAPRARLPPSRRRTSSACARCSPRTRGSPCPASYAELSTRPAARDGGGVRASPIREAPEGDARRARRRSSCSSRTTARSSPWASSTPTRTRGT